MVAVRNSADLTDDLEALALALEGLDLRTAEVRGTNTPAMRDQLVRNIRSYLIPKMSDPEVPLCVVFAGPTGSGKSTLINTISGFELSETGPIRPTTTAPITLVAETHEKRFASIGPFECETVLGRAPILEDMALVDTPDIDSTSTHHREIAETLIDYADVVVFVTSTLRYADNVPWEVLRRATSRGATVLNVLNRYGSKSSGAYVDLQARLADAGIESDVLRVPEHHLGPGAQAVPSLAARELRRRLVEIGQDRRVYAQEVLDRVLGSTLEQARSLTAMVSEDDAWVLARDASVRQRFDGRAEKLDLTSAADRIELGFPETGSAWRRRRWERRADPALGHATSVVVAVDSDLRRLGYTSGASSAAVRQALRSWAEYAARVADEAGTLRRELGQAALMKASLDSDAVAPVEHLYGDRAPTLITRTRKELIKRLQLIYDAASERLVETQRDGLVDPDPTVLTERVAAVVARSHFADA